MTIISFDLIYFNIKLLSSLRISPIPVLVIKLKTVFGEKSFLSIKSLHNLIFLSSEFFFTFFINLLDFEKPLIGAINGHAIGLGATLGLLCDIVISSETAKWGDPHINIGLVPGDGGLAIWTVLVGPNKAKEMMMMGSTIDASAAQQMGLINHVVPETDVLEKALSFATHLAGGPQVAIRGTKISVNNWLKAQFSSLFEVSLAAELQSMDHPDFAEGIKAALEKRTPKWQ